MAKKYKVEIDIDLNDAELEDLEKNLKDAKLEAGKLSDELEDVSSELNTVGKSATNAAKGVGALGKEATKTGGIVSTASKKMGGDLQEVQDDAIAAGSGMKNIQLEAVQAGSATGAFAQKASGEVGKLGAAASKAGDQIEEAFDMEATMKKLKTDLDFAEVIGATEETLAELREEIERLKREGENYNKTQEKTAKSTKETNKETEKSSSLMGKLGKSIGGVSSMLAGAFAGAAFALVNRLVDALINIEPVANMLEDAFLTIDTTVKVLTGNFDQLYESVTGNERGFWDFASAVSVAKNELKDLNETMAINKALTSEEARAVAGLKDSAKDLNTVWADQALTTKNRTDALNQWKATMGIVIALQQDAVDRDLKTTNREIINTGLLREQEELQKTIDFWEDYFDAQGIDSAQSGLSKALDSAREDFKENEAVLAPLTERVSALMLASDNLGRELEDVNEQTLTFTISVEKLERQVVSLISKMPELKFDVDPEILGFPKSFMLDQDFAYDQMLNGLSGYLNSASGQWLGYFKMLEQLDETSLVDSTKNMMLKTEAMSAAIGSSLGTMGALLGELQGLYDDDFKKQKKIELAGIVINTLSGMAMAIAQAMQLGPIAGPIVGALEAATIAAFGAIQYAKAKKVTPENSSADFSAPSVGSSSTLKGGAIPEAEYPGLKSSGPVDVEQTPLKAQVVGEDVYTQQSLDRHVTANAVF
jgi:archaellum component FlaC